MTMPTLTPFDVDKFLDEALRTVNGTTSWAPACNSFEDERSFWIQAAVPGMDRNDIDISVEDDVLTIKGERKDEAAPKGRTSFANWVVVRSSDPSSCRPPRIRPRWPQRIRMVC